MDERTFTLMLNELVREISTMPAGEQVKIETLVQETNKRQEKLQATVKGMQDSIDYLRLSIKYLLFDLEATRRENNYLRKLLEEDPEV